MSTVLVTSFAPARGGGAGLRTIGVIAALALSGDVLVRYVAHDGRAPDPVLQADPRVQLEEIVPARGLARGASYGRALLAGVPRHWARAVSRELIAAGTSVSDHDRLIADGPTVAGALLAHAERRPITYLAHNLEGSFRGEDVLAFERRVLRTYAESWLPTAADLDGARALAGRDAQLRYVPNVVDVAATPVPPLPDGPPTVLFVADFTYPPNADALAYLTGEILPAAWAQEPDLQVLVAGRGVEHPPTDPRVQILGFVDDLEAIYARAHAIAVPLRKGGGSPLKFVEALAHGRPVVTTPHAAALLDRGAPGTDFLVGAGAQEFATQLVQAARSGHAEIGRNGRVLAERDYSVAALGRHLQ